MTGESLRRQAEDFAGRLERLLNGTVTSGAEVGVLNVENYFAIVAPGPMKTVRDVVLVPLSTARSKAEREGASLWLKVRYRVALDAEAQHLTVWSSVFGLCIDRKTGLCPIRVEYDREKTSKQAAHVQVHGESGSLGYAYALARQPLKPMHKLHIPVGGRRFRPTLEDFIEFLHQERLLPGVKQTWKKANAEGRGDWEERQTRAVVRRAPAPAIEQLREMGYTVTSP